MIALTAGGMTIAFFGTRLIVKVPDHRLERAITVRLIAVGLTMGWRARSVPPRAAHSPDRRRANH